MRTLRLGMTGDDVKMWQLFLIGKQGAPIVASGSFDEATNTATVIFQIKNRLSGDGVVGTQSYVVAISQGFPAVTDEHPDGLDKPLKPAGIEPLPVSQVESLFGKFAYVAAPTADNPEAIKIIDGWDKNNIVAVNIPQIAKLKGKSEYKIWCHKLLSNQFVTLFQAWDDAGLADRILTYDGCWNARFKRGSRTSLSNHSWGTACDLNSRWNPLGSVPAAYGQQGCMRELVEIAVQHGFYWGGWFGHDRSDGMHVEAFKIIG